jgi:putative IMPACT (imprinted ancient) family translation regulator
MESRRRGHRADESVSAPVAAGQWHAAQVERAIVDRGSVFTATLFPATSEGAVKAALEGLVRDKAFRFASHNVVAYRLRGANGQIVEHKDDGYSGRGRESGAGRVVLEVLRARQAENVVVVVTRWYGGIKLGGDRFRHFGAAAGMVLDAGASATGDARGD